MDIRIQKQTSLGRARIEASTPKGRHWLSAFTSAALQGPPMFVVIDVGAIEEYEKAAREAGMEVA